MAENNNIKNKDKEDQISLKEDNKVKKNPAFDKLHSRLGGTIVAAGKSDGSFFDLVYEQIDNVIGGDNPNQFLCITLPGQALSAEDFAYDYKKNAAKGPTIEANESRLANKLFDPCHVTGADNGMTLPYQYRSALDMLTPKLNAKIATAKNQLRELLLTSYPYDFGDGETKTYTFQEVFYRLYDEYVAAEQLWSEKQNTQKEELRKRYPEMTPESNARYNDAYLEWYETVSRSETTALNEKRSKVLSVFAPNDMDILDGVLDSGSGAELEQARQTLLNTQKQTPDGGTVYPVKFNPTNWFELLGTSFTPVDLLKTPAALSLQLRNLSSRRITLSARINEIANLVPDEGKVKELREEVGKKQEELDKNQKALIESFGEGFKTVINTAFDIASLFSGGKLPLSVVSKLAEGMQFPSGKTVDDLVTKLNENATKGFEAQAQLLNASKALSDALMNLTEAENMESLKNMLSPMREQIAQLDMQIADIQTQIQISAVIKPASDENTVDNVIPPEVPEGFTQILIEANSSTMSTQTDKQSSASNSTCGVNFWFGGYSSKKETSSSNFQTVTNSANSTVRIGMNVAKVGIEREWFNPGVFVLSKDMFNVSTVRISPSQNYVEMSDERIKEMNKGYVFPCYPVAMLIARDISIELTSDDSSFSSFASSTEEHASHGGGFLFFSGSKSSSSSSSSSGVHTESNDKSVTIKFSTPQIIGYYLQATPADKSVDLDNVSKEEEIAGYVTISKFVEDYKKMLMKMSQKSE